MKKTLLRPLVLLLLAVLAIARCDSLEEPVAIAPGDSSPQISSPLSWSVAEDSSIVINVDADDPNGESMCLDITDAATNGTATVEQGACSQAQPAVAAKTSAASQPPAPDASADIARDPVRKDELRAPSPDKRPAEEELRRGQEARRRAVSPETGMPSAQEKLGHLTTPAAPRAGQDVLRPDNIRLHTRIIRGTQAVAGQTVPVGTIRYIPNPDFNGTDDFLFTVSNQSEFSAEAQVMITINDQPDAPRLLSSIPAQTITESNPFTHDLRTVFFDPDDETLTYDPISSNTTIATTEIREGNTLVVSPGRNGTATITVTATDPGGLFESTDFSVTVDRNAPPEVVNPIENFALVRDQSREFELNDVFSDPDDDSMVFSATSSTPGIARAEVINTSTLQITAQQTDGAVTIAVTADDGNGGRTTMSFTVEVISMGVIALPDADTTTTAIPVDIDVLANDLDAEDRPLRIATILQAPANGTAVIINNDTLVQYTSNAGFVGEDTFSYIVSNNINETDQALVTITVEAPNAEPRLDTPLPDQTIPLDEAESIDLHDFFSDPDDDPLTFSARSDNTSVATTALSGATLSVQGVGSGMTSITVGARDETGSNTEVNDRFQVTVAAPPEVDNPISSQSLVLGQSPFTAALNTVFSDPEDQPLTFSTRSSNTAIATATISGATLTVAAVAEGATTISVTATDPDGLSATTNFQVSVTVPPTNGPPVVDDPIEDQTLVVGGQDFDVDLSTVFSDPDNDALTFDAGSGDENVATATLNGSTLTVAAVAEGTATITVGATDVQGSNTRVTDAFTVTVPPPNDPPVITNPGDQADDEGASVTLPIQATDPDTPLTYTSATLPGGLSLNSSSGVISGTVASNAAGPTGTQRLSVTVFVTDGQGAQSSTVFGWDLNNPDPVVTTPADQSDIAGQAIAGLQITAQDDDGSLSYDDNGTLPTGLSINGSSGLITGTPTTAGTSNVTITVTDAQGGSGMASFSWMITNPSPTLTNVSPDTGDRRETLDVVLTGSGFIAATTVSFSGSNIMINTKTVDSSTQITVNITIEAPAATGARDVTVSNPTPGGGSDTLTGGFTVENPAPTLTNISPDNDDQGETLDVVLTGTGFLAATMVSFSGTGIMVNSVDFDSPTQLTVNITIGASATTGARDVTVMNPGPGGGSDTLDEAFTVNAGVPTPTLTDVSPNSGERLEMLNVVLTGTGFVDGVTTVSFTGTGITVGTTTVDSPTQITVNITISDTAPTTARNVTVTNFGGGSDTLNNAFDVENPAPTLTNVTPPTGAQDTTVNLTLTGTGFIDGVTTVSFNGSGIMVNSETVTSPTQMTVNITISASAPATSRNVTVDNPGPGGGDDTLNNAFTVTN